MVRVRNLLVDASVDCGEFINLGNKNCSVRDFLSALLAPNRIGIKDPKQVCPGGDCCRVMNYFGSEELNIETALWGFKHWGNRDLSWWFEWCDYVGLFDGFINSRGIV